MKIFITRGIDKELNSFERYVCHLQGKLFEESQCYAYGAIDPYDFVEKFMNSEIASDMDDDVCYAHTWGLAQMMETLVEELDFKPFDGNYLNYQALHWVGYMYRYWAWLGKPSREIVKIAPVEKAYMLYAGYHTLDVKEAIRLFIQRA